MWPIIKMAFRDHLAALESAGPEAESARFAGRRMSAADALAFARAR